MKKKLVLISVPTFMFFLVFFAPMFTAVTTGVPGSIELSPTFNITEFVDCSQTVNLRCRIDREIYEGLTYRDIFENKKVSGTGKNLFDGNVYGLMTDGGVIDGRNVYKLQHGTTQFWSFNDQLNSQYTVQFDYKYSGATGYTYFQFLYSDGTDSGLTISPLVSLSWVSKTATSASGKTLIGFKQIFNNVGITYFDKNTFQLELGTTATAYQPYVSTEMLISGSAIYNSDNPLINWDTKGIFITTPTAIELEEWFLFYLQHRNQTFDDFYHISANDYHNLGNNIFVGIDAFNNNIVGVIDMIRIFATLDFNTIDTWLTEQFSGDDMTSRFIQTLDRWARESNSWFIERWGE